MPPPWKSCSCVPIRDRGGSESPCHKSLTTVGFPDRVKESLAWTYVKIYWSGSRFVILFQKELTSEVILIQMVAAFPKFTLADMSHNGLGLSCFSPSINLTNTLHPQKLLQKHITKGFTLNTSSWILELNVIIRIRTLLINYFKHT